MTQNPLGQPSDYPSHYAPELLFPVARTEARQQSNIGQDLPFCGADYWTAWELSWLDLRGKPMVAVANFKFDAESPNIVESKSLKLYLNSLAMTKYSDPVTLLAIVAKDLSETAQHDVAVRLIDHRSWAAKSHAELPGQCLDDLVVDCDSQQVDPSLLKTAPGHAVRQELHSHLLRSNCPVTNQPDIGSLLIRYTGPTIDKHKLLQYIVSYRQHNAFHESCVESIFVDIENHCKTEELTVFACFNRRGGLDINPFRSNYETAIEISRLWRQ